TEDTRWRLRRGRPGEDARGLAVHAADVVPAERTGRAGGGVRGTELFEIVPRVPRASRLLIPTDVDNANIVVGGREVRLTNLKKLFWPERGITKGDLLQYYADVASVLLPHIEDRAMVMKRYPHGWAHPFFFMKRAPTPRPSWIRTCTIDHGNGNIIDFPVIDDLPSLLWVINLGCIDLNQWYARC